MLWFKFILGFEFASFVFEYAKVITMTWAQKKKKIQPPIKLNHKIYSKCQRVKPVLFWKRLLSNQPPTALS